MGNNKINVCCITDSNYVIATLIAIKSLISNKKFLSEIIIHVFANNLTDYEKNCIKRLKTINCEIKILDISDKIPDIECQHTRVTKTALAKFVIPQLLRNIDKIIYLDTDILILKDIAELFNIQIADEYAAVVKDIYATYNDYTKKLNLKHYFNSGVMLLNLKKMREDNITEKLIEYRTNDSDSSFMDQSAFNKIFDGNVKFIDVKYNYLLTIPDSYSQEEIESFYGRYIKRADFNNDIIVLHIANYKKPWCDIYYKYFDIFIPYILRLPSSNIKKECIDKLYNQNPGRFIKYTLKQIFGLKNIINFYEHKKYKEQR